MNEQNNDTQNEISLLDLYHIIRRNIVLIFAFTTLFAILAGVYAFVIADAKYSSNADVMVQVEVDTAVEGSFDYSTAQKLLTTIAEYMSKDIVLDEVINDLDLDRTTNNLRSSLTVTSSLTSYFINIKFVDEEPQVARDIVNSVIENAISIANDNPAFTSLKDKITRTSYASPYVYESPNKPLYLVIGIILGGIIGVGFVFIKEFLNNSYKTKEQLEAAFDIQVLGVIPTFEVKEDF
jgi:capsular polysaccharide biosynthesis protein